jgi:hypothetical protein
MLSRGRETGPEYRSAPSGLRREQLAADASPFPAELQGSSFHPSPLERALLAAYKPNGIESAFRGLSGFSDTNNQLCLFFSARPNEASGEEACLQ